jgi:hypothetical protein
MQIAAGTARAMGLMIVYGKRYRIQASARCVRITSVWKYPVAGHRLVKRLDVVGDAQGDLNAGGFLFV